MRIDFQTALNANDGYGYAAQELILALAKTHKVYVEPIKAWYDYNSLKETTKTLIKKAHQCDFQFSFFYPTGDIRIRNNRAANITMFEATRCPIEWSKAINQRRVPILAPSKFVQEMFENSNLNVPVYHLPFGIDTSFWVAKERSVPESRPFRFLIMGKLEPRKNSLFTVNAFRKAFQDENVQLVVKTREHFLDRDILRIATIDKRVKIIEQTLDEESLRSLYYACDAFVFCSRGEGFSFPPRFAVATNMPTIVTNWSALAEIEGAIKVSVKSFSAMPTCGFSYGQEKEMLMADADEEHLIDCMRNVYYNYEQCKPNAQQGTWYDTVSAFENLYKEHFE